MNILVVEDDCASRKLLSKLVSDFGTVEAVEDGLKAIEMFERAMEQNKIYDVIFLDIMLPGMSGQHVLKRVREVEYENGITGMAGVKIIMTTALGDSANIMEAFRSQCEAYLTKPISKSAVIKELKDLGLIPG